jgi:hypothetical protein
VKGIGDFNGDGKSDVFWQYAGRVNHGQLAVWWNGQETNPVPWYPAVVSDDTVVFQGVGDFDGDNKSDVLWRHTGTVNHGQLDLWFGGQNTSPVPAHPPNPTGDTELLQGTGSFN